MASLGYSQIGCCRMQQPIAEATMMGWMTVTGRPLGNPAARNNRNMDRAQQTRNNGKLDVTITLQPISSLYGTKTETNTPRLGLTF
jgi:hypothetical protein